MTTEEKAAFLDKFVPKPKKTTVAFLLSAGLSAKASTLVGDRLNGVAVVGIGLPSFPMNGISSATITTKSTKKAMLTPT
jgi:DNA excision repair protein ERCC-2